MEPHELMTASEAARLLGCSPEKVRQHIRAGVWKFGVCIPKQKGGKKDSFIIYRRQLMKTLEGAQ